MKRYLYTFRVLLWVLAGQGWVFGQTLQVLDYATKKPITQVHIINISETKATVTDSLGRADISDFTGDELMVFSHTAYTEVLFRKSDLYTSHYKLTLHPRVFNLDEFVISANKRGQVREEVPNQISTISANDIQLSNPQTSADVLTLTGKVFVQKSQLGGGSPMIRGFAANRVLIVVDGVRMNNAIFREGNLQNVISIDPNIVQKSEVVFGPGSVIYGSDAMGGVMNFQTLSTLYSDTGKVYVGSAFQRFSSANGELTSHVDFTFGKKQFSSVTAVTYSRFLNQLMGAHGPEEYLRKEYVPQDSDSMIRNPNPRKQYFSKYQYFSILQKFGYKFNDRYEINYSFIGSSTSDIPRYDRLIQYNNNHLKYAIWNYGPQVWLVNTLSLNINSPNHLFDNLRVTAAYQYFKESREDRKAFSAQLRERTEKVQMLSLNFDFDNEISGRTTLFYGIESVFNYVNSEGYSMNLFSYPNYINDLDIIPIQPRYPDGSKYWSNAAYINIKMNQSERNTVVFGLRYNHINLNAILDTNFYKVSQFSVINQSTGALTGSIGVAHRPSDRWQLNATFSSGFKAPNIDDIAKVFDSEPGNVIVPNPNLKPEYLYSIDALVSRSFGPNSQHKIELSGFYSFLVSAMVRRDILVNGKDSLQYDGDLSKTQALVNTGSANIAGLSLSFESVFSDSWKVMVAGTYTYGKDSDGFYLRHIAPFFGNMHIIHTINKLQVDAYTLFNGSVPNWRMSPSELAKPHLYLMDDNRRLYSPGWYTVNLKVSYRFSKAFMGTTGVENITNQRYRPYSSGIVAPGINWIISIKATF